MKIVIEISSYDKEWITNGYYIPEEINMRISEAIANGIPLPKKHGRLIDADKLKMTTITRWNGDVDFVVYKEELDNAPTVIESEGEE